MTNLDEWGRSALHYAARDGDVEAINGLLATEDVNAADSQGWTPLHFAAQDAHPAAIERLLDAGADIDALTEKGWPAVYLAALASGNGGLDSCPAGPRCRPSARDDDSYFGLKSPLYLINRWSNQDVIQAEFADLK
ncbi:ankyrin repeat domain-containing protein [Nocardia salmonicida]|uniref:ankyrin repeat domain-containing protein n=1 Tax=Nocardia salmonicida TaxID=53431 RepID=UPI003714CB30